MNISMELSPALVITHVGGGWDAFCSENGGDPRCESGQVIGRSLLEFVSGDPTRLWLEKVLSHAGIKGEAIEHHYRCDSPYLKRHMRMRILPGSDGFRIDYKLVRLELLQVPIRFTVTRDIGGTFYHRCSICNRIENEGCWIEPEGLFSGSMSHAKSLLVEHVICPGCEWRDDV